MILRQTSRPQAHFPLYPGRFSFGNGQDDDILLGNSSAIAVAIYIDDQFILQSCSVPIWVDGKTVSKFPLTLEPGMVLSLDESTHVFIGNEDDAIPSDPVIVTEQKPAPKKAVSYRQIGAIGLVTTILAVAFSGLNWGLERFFVQAGQIIEQEKPLPSTQDLRHFVTSTLGDHLLEMTEKDGILVILARVNPRQSIQAADIALVVKNNYELTWFDPVEQTNQVKAQLADAIKGFHIQGSNLQVIISGIALSNNQDSIERSIDRIAKNHPRVQILSQIHFVTPNFTVTSVAISNRYAAALLKQGDKSTWVTEGAPVFNLGRLKLITAKSIIVATQHGDLTISRVYQ